MWAAFLAAGLMFVLFTLILFFKFTGQ